MPRLLLACIAAFTLGAGLAAAADQLTLTLEPAETEVGFTLGATLHTVHGSAPLRSGVVRFDPNGGPAEGEVVVDAGRAATGNERRDKDMHEKVLHSPKFPSVVLRPTRIEGELPSSGAAVLTVHGTIELTGRHHELSFPAEVVVNADKVAIRVEFELPYVAWGLTDPSKLLLAVDKHVTVTVAAAGRISDRARQPSAEDQPQP